MTTIIPTLVLRKPRVLSLDFILCTLSLTMLLASAALKAPAIVGFLAPWIFVAIRKPHGATLALVQSWPLFLIPMWCLLSALWSSEPTWTIKASLELVSTITVGIWAARLIDPDTFIAALLSALLLVAFACVLTGGQDIVGDNEEYVLQGIFNSKNAFSVTMGLLMLTSVSVLAARTPGFVFRALGLAGLFAAPLLLFLGQSLGAVLSVVLTLAFFAVGRAAARSGSLMRAVFMLMAFIVLIAGIEFLMIGEVNPMRLLDLFGKDSTLTGRTNLWERSLGLISNSPWLGTGYRAFWRIGNPDAESLWFESNVPSGAGFSFHNEYLQTLVELGIPGLLLLVSILAIMAIRAVKALSAPSPGAQQIFAGIVLLFFLSRTPVEAGLLNQFDIGTLLISVMWVYLRPRMEPRFIEQAAEDNAVLPLSGRERI